MTPTPDPGRDSPAARRDRATEGDACLTDDAVSSLVDGELSLEERVPLLQHLEQCSTCQDLLALVMQARGSAAGALPSSLPLNFGSGSIVGGRYRIDRFMARGGMGEVYDAFDCELGERVALKTVLSTSSDSERAQQRLKAEVQLARKISHPNVCRIYDFGRHDLDEKSGIHFLSMEFIEGESLGQRLRRSPLALEDAECIAEQLLMGLSAAHEAGVLHRDFKSDNVMLRANTGSNARAVVTDFGLARALEPGAQSRQNDSQRFAGSAAYMAPEQVLGDDLGPPADIYAFGVVFFEMLTTRLPFVGDSPMTTAAQRLSRLPPSPSVARPGLGRSWDEFVLACLRRQPNTRFQTAEAALAEFRRVLVKRRRRASARLRWWLPTSLLVVLAVAGLSLAERRLGPGSPPLAPTIVSASHERPLPPGADGPQQQVLSASPRGATGASLRPADEPSVPRAADAGVVALPHQDAPVHRHRSEPKPPTQLPHAGTQPQRGARRAPAAVSSSTKTRAHPTTADDELTLDRSDPWSKSP